MRDHTGRAIKLGHDIDTDVIIPTEYMTLPSIEEMKQYAFAPLRPDIPSKAREGDILVAGRDFGCGSSREQAPEIIKALGFYCVVATSYSRLFYRNALNNGLLVIQSEGLHERVEEDQALTVRPSAGELELASGERISFGAIPSSLLQMVEEGGLVEYWRRRNRGCQ